MLQLSWPELDKIKNASFALGILAGFPIGFSVAVFILL